MPCEGCSAEIDPTSPAEVAHLAAAQVGAELVERLAGPLAELTALQRQAHPVRIVPSDEVTLSARRIHDGAQWTIPAALDRVRVRVTPYASDGSGGGLAVVWVGLPGQTVSPAGNGIGWPVVAREGYPVTPFELDTRSPLEVWVQQLVGDGVVSVLQEHAQAHQGV